MTSGAFDPELAIGFDNYRFQSQGCDQIFLLFLRAIYNQNVGDVLDAGGGMYIFISFLILTGA